MQTEIYAFAIDIIIVTLLTFLKALWVLIRVLRTQK